VVGSARDGGPGLRGGPVVVRTYISEQTQRAIRQAVTAHGAQFLTYDDAGHAFDNPDPAFHHAAASVEAWAATVRFLQQHLRGR